MKNKTIFTRSGKKIVLESRKIGKWTIYAAKFGNDYCYDDNGIVIWNNEADAIRTIGNWR